VGVDGDVDVQFGCFGCFLALVALVAFGFWLLWLRPSRSLRCVLLFASVLLLLPLLLLLPFARARARCAYALTRFFSSSCRRRDEWRVWLSTVDVDVV